MSGLPTENRATALKFNEPETVEVLGHGRGYHAERMVELAQEHNILLLQDFALSQQLAGIAPGELIPADVFHALSAVLNALLVCEQEAQQELLCLPPPPGQ